MLISYVKLDHTCTLYSINYGTCVLIQSYPAKSTIVLQLRYMYVRVDCFGCYSMSVPWNYMYTVTVMTSKCIYCIAGNFGEVLIWEFGIICDPLWKNWPLAIFYENRVLGMDRRRFYCRVQRSKSQALKSFLSRVMAKKLYTGHPCLSSQFFEKRSVLYVHSSTFSVSVYAPYYTTRFAP